MPEHRNVIYLIRNTRRRGRSKDILKGIQGKDISKGMMPDDISNSQEENEENQKW